MEENEVMQEVSVAEEAANANEIPDAALVDAITSDEPAPQQEEPAQDEPEQTPEQAQRAAIEKGLHVLFEDGWTEEDLTAFANDETVRADIKAGKDIMRAAAAYERRQRSAMKETGKKSVPTVKTASPGRKTGTDAERIKAMSKKEFAEFSRRAEQAAKQGKRVLI